MSQSTMNAVAKGYHKKKYRNPITGVSSYSWVRDYTEQEKSEFMLKLANFVDELKDKSLSSS